MKKRKICVITGSRADYDILYPLITQIEKDKELELILITTGMHLSSKFGSTYKYIENDGFKINEKIKILSRGDSPLDICESIGKGCKLFPKVFNFYNPDIIVVLGDRFEIFSAVVSAFIQRIPIAHIHGGELTKGAIDDALRHSITKMSFIHFVSTEEYRRRVIQLGEQPDRVFNYGALAMDNIHKMKVLNKKQLSKLLKFDLTGKIVLCTYHPVTLETKTAQIQIKNLLEALDEFNIKIIFTSTNADPEGQIINKKINRYCKKYKNKAKFFYILGREKYFSLLNCADLVVGNSSSAIIEAPSFRIPVINIGDRQSGRIKAENIIDVGTKKEEIRKAIKLALSDDFREKIKNIKNPYDKYNDGKIAYRIKEKLKKILLDKSKLKKEFYDIILNYKDIKK